MKSGCKCLTLWKLWSGCTGVNYVQSRKLPNLTRAQPNGLILWLYKFCSNFLKQIQNIQPCSTCSTQAHAHSFNRPYTTTDKVHMPAREHRLAGTARSRKLQVASGTGPFLRLYFPSYPPSSRPYHTFLFSCLLAFCTSTTSIQTSRFRSCRLTLKPLLFLPSHPRCLRSFRSAFAFRTTILPYFPSSLPSFLPFTCQQFAPSTFWNVH